MKEIPPVYPAFLRKCCPEKLSSETESVVKGQIRAINEKVGMNAQAERLQESRMREIRTSGLRRGSSGSQKMKAALYSIKSMLIFLFRGFIFRGVPHARRKAGATNNENRVTRTDRNQEYNGTDLTDRTNQTNLLLSEKYDFPF